MVPVDSEEPEWTGAAPRVAEAALIAAARALASSLDVTDMCAAILEAVGSAFGATSSGNLLIDSAPNQLRTVGFRGRGAQAFSGQVMPADAGVMGLSMSSGNMVFVPDAGNDD